MKSLDISNPPALRAKLYLINSASTDVLTEQGRQINNGNLHKTAAYLTDGSPRMGFSREPADFAFAGYVKTKSGDINSTKGKNVLAAMSQSGSPTQNNPGGASIDRTKSPQSSSNVVQATARSFPEVSKGNTLNVSA